MKLTELKTAKELTFPDVACRLLVPRALPGTEGRVTERDGGFELVTKNGSCAFQIEDRQDAAAIADLMHQRRQNLAYTAGVRGGDQEHFRLHIAFFHRAAKAGRWVVVPTEPVEETLRSRKLLRDKDKFQDVLERNFLLFNGTEPCFAYTVGKYDPNEFEHYGRKERPKPQTEAVPEEEETEPQEAEVREAEVQEPEAQGPEAEDLEPQEAEAPEPEAPALSEEKCIRLYGADFSLQLRMRGERGKEYLLAEKVDVRNRRTPPMELGVGTLTFQEGSAYISESIRQELESISGYLDLWAQYTSVEGDFLLRRAREAGAFTFQKTFIHGKGLGIYPQGLTREQWKYFTEGERLIFTPELPPYLSDETMTWQAYQEDREDRRAQRAMLGQRGPLDERERREIALVNENDGYLVLKNSDNEGFPKGIGSLSISGDESQIVRRENARRRIDAGLSANPTLGLLIEGRLPELTDELRGARKKVEPLSAFVREKIFGANDPTPVQVEAIRIALNTPDIAIIQGPPGTGKTQVITAIIERLNEIADQRRDNRGSVLVTSFQHSAVRNVCQRLQINSLPTVKFGSQGAEDRSMDELLEDWCANYAKALRAQNPSVRRTEEQEKLRELYQRYFTCPSDANALRFLACAREVDRDRAFTRTIEALEAELRAQETDQSSRLTVKIRGLRTSRESFLDDGSEQADRLLYELEKLDAAGGPSHGLEHILEVLEEAAGCAGPPSEALLAELKRAKRELLRRCIPRPVYRVKKPWDEIVDLYQQLAQAIRRPADEMDEILFRLLNELENNSSQIEAAVAGYNFVYAATTQQCEGGDIRRIKGVRGRSSHPVYDTVIVDEAARVNPGDLMIPMAQAARRIILVGDHRQLPHIYDEEIFENMVTNDGSIDKNIVKESMFEYLIAKAKKLTEQDGINRTITLDAQYRTHPVLGEFVSQNFYEPYGEGFRSPNPPEKYAQGLWHKPIQWVNLPLSAGRTERRGTSRVRRCEAEYIAQAIKQCLESPEGRDLSYGVITFYREQAKLITSEIGRRLKPFPKKVQVGSVDAFQGLEYDVIFLSVVRSRDREVDVDWNRLEADVSLLSRESRAYQDWNAYRQKCGLSHYGFLTSENRLCVALSRQKRLLVLVGDSGAFTGGDWGRLAQCCVPAMKRMAELCWREGVLVDAKTGRVQPV